MIFLELSLKKTSRMTKSDIWGWQHLRLSKYLLDSAEVILPGALVKLPAARGKFDEFAMEMVYEVELVQIKG